MGLGVLSKGPLVFLHVGIALLAHGYCYRTRPGAGRLAHAAGLGLMLAIAAPWPAYVLTHVPHAAALWTMETTRGGGGAGIGRVLGESWQYLPRLAELSLPWTPAWLAGLALAVARRAAAAARAAGDARSRCCGVARPSSCSPSCRRRRTPTCCR
jgi:4-amino-4-deoxy-L-arabinose transferase-like glycosyltransferase